MEQPGRKSVGKLASADATRHLVERVGPPSSLTTDQKRLWVKITNSLPADWFSDDNAALLEEYCRVTTSLQFINVGIDALEQTDETERAEGWIPQYRFLLRERVSLARLQLSMARGLRLNPASRMRSDKAGPAANKPRSKNSLWS